jgi:Iodothyronine deiodinase
MDSNVKDEVVFDQPKTDEARRDAAKILVERLKYRMPVALDPIDDRVGKAFAAWPERIYVVGVGGRILYKGGMGPFGFHPEEAEKLLADQLGPSTSASPTPPS